MNKFVKLKQLRFVIHPLFIMLSIYLILSGYGYYFFNTLLVVILHEYAHYFVAKCLGYKLNKVCLLPYGAQLNLSKTILNDNDEILIALAGPAINLVFAILGTALWWIFPQTYIFTSTFVNINLVIAIFNLLPIIPLDGSRVVLALLSKSEKRKQGYKILNFFNVALSILLFICFIISAFYQINITLGILSIFIFVGAFEKDNAYLYSPLYTIAKMQFLNSKPIKVKFYAVNKKISKIKLFRLINPNYYLVIIVLDDNMKPIKYIYESDFEKYF